MNLATCKFIVWGFKNVYHTHGHIHEGFYRALRYMGRNVQWLDHRDDVSNVDFSDTFFITNHDIAAQLPAREDCFYMVHGGSDNAECRDKFWNLQKHMSWNVFIDWSYAYDDAAPFGRRPLNRPEAVWVDEDMPFYPSQKHMDLRWATDLMPPEIEANKAGAQLLNQGSRVINYVGTYWRVNEKEISEFGRACSDNGVTLRHLGGGQAEESFNHHGHSKVVSIEDNVRLVRESYFAPAIVGSHHLTEGYAPCRIFKNISYGQFGVTNSAAVNRVFGGKLIFNADPYQLFTTAREQLAMISIDDLHRLMDEVATKHTYVNRLNGILKAAQMITEGL